MTTNIRCTISFEDGMLKNLMSIKDKLCKQNAEAISRQVSPASLQDVSDGNCQGALVDKSGMIRIQMGIAILSVMVAV
jgi:hypothetical protein